jgi:hypothetical protein
MRVKRALTTRASSALIYEPMITIYRDEPFRIKQGRALWAGELDALDIISDTGN